MAVEITKGMEGIMTDAQWLSTCVRNTWRKQKQAILIEIIFPCLLAVLLATMFTWILWLLLDRYKIKESLQLKYTSFPLTVVITAWALAKKVMSTVNPVLSAIKLVLAVCEINVVLGMDKELIQRAIMKRHGDKSLKNSKLADKYLQKIIQLPLDLSDLSEEQSRSFLGRHLGVFQKQSKEGYSESRTDDEVDSVPKIDTAYNNLFSLELAYFGRSQKIMPWEIPIY